MKLAVLPLVFLVTYVEAQPGYKLKPGALVQLPGMGGLEEKLRPKPDPKPGHPDYKPKPAADVPMPPPPPPSPKKDGSPPPPPCADGVVPDEYIVTLRSKPGVLHTKKDRQLSVAYHSPLTFSNPNPAPNSIPDSVPIPPLTLTLTLLTRRVLGLDYSP